MITGKFEQEKDINNMIYVLEAYKKGEIIEYRKQCKNHTHDTPNPWTVNSDPKWDFSVFEYRVKPKFRVENTQAYDTVDNIIALKESGYSKKFMTTILAQYARRVCNDEKIKEQNQELLNNYAE